MICPTCGDRGWTAVQYGPNDWEQVQCDDCWDGPDDPMEREVEVEEALRRIIRRELDTSLTQWWWDEKEAEYLVRCDKTSGLLPVTYEAVRKEIETYYSTDRFQFTTF